MNKGDAIRAFSDTCYEYYRLTQDLGGLVPKGAIFVHDPCDTVYGSISQGCLKLCWTPDGDCYHGSDGSLCAGTVIFHYHFVQTDMFEKVDIQKLNSSFDSIAGELSQGHYEIDIASDGSWKVRKFGRKID